MTHVRRFAMKVAFAVAVFASTLPCLAQTISEFRIRSSGTALAGLTSGPDGNLWFTENLGTRIGMMTMTGAATEFNVTGGFYPLSITNGPDGNLWFTIRGGDLIGRSDTQGNINYYSLTPGRDPIDIVAGPDGALWFTEQGADRIGRITTSGVISEFSLPASPSSPWGICVGPDANLWFAEANGGRIGRITTGGVLTEFVAAGTPTGIATGPDGALWFTDEFGDRIGRMTTAGQLTWFPTNTPAEPLWITAGSDGNMWFSERVAHKVGRIAPDGSVDAIPVPSGGQPFRLVTGPDLAIWFTEFDNDRIGRVNLSPPPGGPYAYFVLDPCRLIDTRFPPGPLGGPSIEPAGIPDRMFVVTSSCAIPVDAKALSVNVTVANMSDQGFLLTYRGDGQPTGPDTVALLPGKTRAGNTILQLSMDGSGTMKVQNTSLGTLDLVLDVNGFFR